MRKESKISQRGAIMVEILAVLALIGVMGPVLFRQVLNRNQEISNVNMASEMRTIKEALSAMIAADGAVLGAKCAPTSSNAQLCSNPSGGDLIESLRSFLPAGIDETGIIDYYNVYRWKEGLYFFKSKRFTQIMEDLERYYDLKIQVDKKSIESVALTGKFRISDGLDYALRVLQKDVAFTYRRDKDNDVIYIK